MSKDIKYADNQPIVLWGPRYFLLKLTLASFHTAIQNFSGYDCVKHVLGSDDLLCECGHYNWYELVFLSYGNVK